MADVESMFAGMNKAEMFGKGTFMGPGKYRVRPKVVKVHEGFKGKSFIHEFEILESSNEKHAIGSSGSWVVKLGPQNANAFSDMKSFSFACLGIDPKTVRKPEEDPTSHAVATDTLKAQCDKDWAKKNGFEEDPLIGRELELEVILVKTQKGTDFSRHNWSPTPEAVAAYKEITG